MQQNARNLNRLGSPAERMRSSEQPIDYGTSPITEQLGVFLRSDLLHSHPGELRGNQNLQVDRHTVGGYD